jgi:hypothetical protein
MSWEITHSKLYGEYLLFIVIIFSLVIDMLNGYLLNIVGVHTPIGIIYRGVLMFVLFIIFFKSTSTIFKRLLCLNLFLFLLAVSSWFLFQENFSIFIELTQVSKLFYLNLFIVYVNKYKYRFKFDYVIKLGVYWGLISCFTNIICFFAGFGVNSYGESSGFGVKAFFNAGNDFGLACIMSLLISCIYCIRERSKLSLLYLIIICVGTLLIGTRGVLVSVPLILVSTVLYIGFINDREIFLSKRVKHFIGLFIGFGLIIGFIKMVLWGLENVKEDYIRNRMTFEGLSNARTSLIDVAIDSISNFNSVEFFFGRGYYGSTSYIGNSLNLSVNRMIEADFYEIISSYGWLFGICLLMPYILLYMKSIRLVFKNKSYLSFLAFIGLSLILWHGVLAGHVVFNAMLVPFMGIFYLLLSQGHHSKKS